MHRNGSLVDLSPTEYHILEYLLHHPRKVISKQELLEHLYDYNWEHHSNVIEAHVSNLRKKLDSAVPDADPVIETLRGRGYRLLARALVMTRRSAFAKTSIAFRLIAAVMLVELVSRGAGHRGGMGLRAPQPLPLLRSHAPRPRRLRAGRRAGR